MAIKIMLDPGHGQYENRGYIGKRWKHEGTGNWYFSRLLMAELQKYGFIVGTTRPKITDNPGLEARGRMAKGYDLFISLHTNATRGTGTEIWEDVNQKAPNLAYRLCETISKTLGIRNRGIKHRYYKGDDWYGVLRANKANGGMLIEHCFHDTLSDVKVYEEKAEILAKEMAKTIAIYYGKKITEPKGVMTMLGRKPVAIISIVNEKDATSGAMAQLMNYLYPSYNVVITKSGLFDYSEIKSNYIIALGGNKAQHSGYCNYFVSGRTAEDTLVKAKDFRKNKEKYRV